MGEVFGEQVVLLVFELGGGAGIGEAIARLSVDPRRMEKSGHVQLIAELADEYGLAEADGRKPRIDDFTRELREKINQIEGALGW